MKFRSRLATQHYEEMSEIIAGMIEKWDARVMSDFGKELDGDGVASLTTAVIQIKCQQLRKIALEAATIDIQDMATETAVSAELCRELGRKEWKDEV